MRYTFVQRPWLVWNQGSAVPPRMITRDQSIRWRTPGIRFRPCTLVGTVRRTASAEVTWDGWPLGAFRDAFKTNGRLRTWDIHLGQFWDIWSYRSSLSNQSVHNQQNISLQCHFPFYLGSDPRTYGNVPSVLSYPSRIPCRWEILILRWDIKDLSSLEIIGKHFLWVFLAANRLIY